MKLLTVKMTVICPIVKDDCSVTKACYDCLYFNGIKLEKHRVKDKLEDKIRIKCNYKKDGYCT